MEQKLGQTSFAFAVLLCMFASTATAQLRVVTWNTAGGPRSGLGDILEAIGNEEVNGIAKPIDVLSLQEQSSSVTTTQAIVDLLNDIYGAGTYDRATLDGGTSGGGRPGLIYNTTTVSLESQAAFGEVNTSAQARQTLRYELGLAGYDDAEFVLYSNHYKASTGPTNRARRLVEAEAVRANADQLGQGTNIIYTGDFNIRSSSEDMYAALLAPGNGQAFDPIDSPGNWHESATFAAIHTQAPASVSSGGLAGSGVDDRFDFQLVSGELLDGEGLNYIPGSYRSFGNNGTHTLSGAISTGTGASSEILQTLEAVSDHLPVIADYQVPAVLSATSLVEIPAQIPLGASIEFEILVENAASVVASLGADELDYEAIGAGDVFGNFVDTDFALDGGNLHTFTLDTSSLGTKSGEILVSSLSPESVGFESFLVDYEVIAIAENADFNNDLDVDGSDFLTWQIGFGSATTFESGDANSSGTVDGQDLSIWQTQYAGTPSAIQNVPEPNGAALIVCCLLLFNSVGRRTSLLQ